MTAPDEALEEPWRDQLVEVRVDYGSPEVLALVAFVLGVLSIAGFGLLNGSVYVVQSFDPGGAHQGRYVLGALLGAAFALIPVWLGWRTAARILPSDARWISSLARTAVVLGLLSLVLRLVLAVILASSSTPTGLGRF